MHSSALQQPLYPMLPHAMQVGGGEGGGGKGGGGGNGGGGGRCVCGLWLCGLWLWLLPISSRACRRNQPEAPCDPTRRVSKLHG